MKEAKKRPAPADPLAHPVWEIGRTYYTYIGLLERVLAETGLDRHLRPGMGPPLFALFEEDGRRITEIAARVQLSASTLTGLLNRMERAGLVERRGDPKDGRVVRVHLTALGRSLKPRCAAALRTMEEILRAGLSAADLDQAKRLFQRLTEVMSAAEKQRRPGAGKRQS